MIISASRRTDIPAYYTEWFMNRIKEEYVLVRNPMNIHQVSKINLSPDVVDCIVFWTKNPKAMIEQLNNLHEYNYYFQFTLNSYGKDIEASVPSKKAEVIDTFKRLSDKIGAEKIIWRYDPIFINAKYSIEYHIKYFEKLARQLRGYTEKCTISFIDYYSKIMRNIKKLDIHKPSEIDKWVIAENLSKIAFEYGLKMDTCAEDMAFEDLGITHAKCIDDKLISRIIKSPISVDKDKNQRLQCGCVKSIDIGLYNTCKNDCKYCYANHSTESVINNMRNYNSKAPLLCSELNDQDKITERNMKSLKSNQLNQLDMFTGRGSN
ncbi:DUF1848 domain-containing protein [Anaerovorax odorimutans]|uniref:DUF1848 domain-containing protein n=1 Tax=Anaerovorax odorimutans TaxID=109327 RepID=UPI0004194B65|nr:DUF1848 domain-containing protein [Anaerovorax odorimutans]